MKKFVVLFIFIKTLCSCESKCEELTDEFVNNSNRKIEVIVYKNNQPNIPSGTFSRKHILENNTSLKRTVKNCAPYGERLSIGTLLQGDSIVIDFGDRKLKYGIINLSSTRNPFYLQEINQNQYNFTYTLTPEDYANALP